MAEEEVTNTTTTTEETTATATTATAAPAPATAPAARKKKAKRSVPSGQVHIQASFNNTIVVFTDKNGNVLTTASAGGCGFRGSKKGTAYAAQVASDKAAQAAKQNFGMSIVDVFVKGIGLGRDAAIRSLNNSGIQVESIRDITGVAHGGCRPPKQRRV
ncbi:MAG TPA: 30S ribosomal protein S11 [Candidatus Saccharimonadales bacterium]|nr:30S ribosomal protein S11 [Candidatus Saccharimonadales bacterium]